MKGHYARRIEPIEERKTDSYRSFEDLYRAQWTWDRVAWGTHCVDCYPGNCPFRVYVKDGVVLREEQAGTFVTVENGVPDMNPMGCQKGAAWSEQLLGPERLLYPLRRVGERGEGRWVRISWEAALDEIADAMLDAIEASGPESIVGEGTPEPIASLGRRLIGQIGGTVLDPVGETGDFTAGVYLTFGKFFASSVDDWFHSELLLIWHRNPAYTQIGWAHYLTEARYAGAEVVTISPDVSPSAIHADLHLPVEPGSDAALALGMCQVIVEESLFDAAFVQSQTDLPLLVRRDTRRFLRASDMAEDGSDEQLFFWDAHTKQVVEAPRATLSLDGASPALDGRTQIRLRDGTNAEVMPVFELLRTHLRSYTPESVSVLCGVNPKTIRHLARKVAARRTNILLGWNSAKYYHGDLMERSMCLLLALTGNWGQQGAGIRSWVVAPLEGVVATQVAGPGIEHPQDVLALQAQGLEAMMQYDPSLTDEMAAIEMGRTVEGAGSITPPAFFWYRHCGYRTAWNEHAWHAPDMRRPFDEYVREALDADWWPAAKRLDEHTPPRVMIVVGGNPLRRTRGGQSMLLEHLWPKLELIVSVDFRMNTTAMHSDLVLPAAQHYEKIDYHLPTPEIGNFTLSERVVDPPGEAKEEWEIFARLARALERRAAARGLVEYRDASGQTRRLDDLYRAFTLDGRLETKEQVVGAVVDAYVASKLLPEDTNLDTLREHGFVRFLGMGRTASGLAQAADFELDRTHAPLVRHVRDGLPYPTFTRRAQVYIDHAWFLEAGEELPCYKPNPHMGGEYPLVLTSGHGRWSIHAMNMTNVLMLQSQRGQPVILVSTSDAAARGIRDGDDVQLFNDLGSSLLVAKVSSQVRPGQVIAYNGWEPYMFRGWRDVSRLEPGMVKWLHFAGGYGHLRYWPLMWQPQQVDRALRVDLARATQSENRS